MRPVLVRRPADIFGVDLGWRDQAQEARRRLRQALWPTAQAAVAAGVAWYVAHDLLGHPQPFFAPIAAAISLSTSEIGQARRILQMVIGVMLGIGIGEAFASGVGTGPLELTAVVALTMTAALLTGIGFLSEGMMFVNQAAASAILVLTLRRSGTGAERIVDALVGGGVAAVIGVGLFPLDPLTLIRDAQRELLRSISGALGEVARLLALQAAPAQGWVLAVALDVHAQLAALTQARRAARLTARIAPRRRRLRGAVAAEEGRSRDFDLMADAALGVIRTATDALEAGEPIPPSLGGAVGELAGSLAALSDSPQPWPPALLPAVAARVNAALDTVAPRAGPQAPVLAAVLRAFGRDLLGVLRPTPQQQLS
jgi:uncharacterized membrane protein YgaE (UPF0421/DUF939 family)